MYSGFIIIRLEAHTTHDTPDLGVLAAEHGLTALAGFLEEHADLDPQRLIRHTDPVVLRDRETQYSGSDYPPLVSLADYWRLNCAGHDAEVLREALLRIPGIELAYREAEASNPGSPAASCDVNHNPYAKFEHYLASSPCGIGAYAAWEKGVAGAGVAIADIEAGWILDHEDLPGPTLRYGDNGKDDGSDPGDHGAAVMGVIAGMNNNLGGIGIAPGVASISAYSRYCAGTKTGNHTADAISAATQDLEPGDVLLIEVQLRSGTGNVPAEADSAIRHAIRQASAKGIVVIEAGGNGPLNLDTWTNHASEFSLKPGSGAFVDSGAVMVGSSRAAVSTDDSGAKGHTRYYTSNYGTRVNVYAWGERLYTAGFGWGPLQGATGSTDSYSSNFGQTSGASAVIAAVAALVQSWHKAKGTSPLSPSAMRSLLTDPDKGTAQIDRTGGPDGPIGVMPDLALIMTP